MITITHQRLKRASALQSVNISHFPNKPLHFCGNDYRLKLLAKSMHDPSRVFTKIREKTIDSLCEHLGRFVGVRKEFDRNSDLVLSWGVRFGKDLDRRRTLNCSKSTIWIENSRLSTEKLQAFQTLNFGELKNLQITALNNLHTNGTFTQISYLKDCLSKMNGCLISSTNPIALAPMQQEVCEFAEKSSCVEVCQKFWLLFRLSHWIRLKLIANSKQNNIRN